MRDLTRARRMSASWLATATPRALPLAHLCPSGVQINEIQISRHERHCVVVAVEVEEEEPLSIDSGWLASWLAGWRESDPVRAKTRGHFRPFLVG